MCRVTVSYMLVTYWLLLCLTVSLWTYEKNWLSRCPGPGRGLGVGELHGPELHELELPALGLVVLFVLQVHAALPTSLP